MKKRILFMLCVLVATFSLTACKDEKPHVDTETERHSQVNSASEDERDTQEQDDALMFLEFISDLVEIPDEEYNRLPQGLFLNGIIENNSEWIRWAMEKGLQVNYNVKMWENNLLLVFSSKGAKGVALDIEKIEGLSYDGEDILVTDSVIQKMDTDFSYDEEACEVRYQLLWVKRAALSDETKSKYDLNHLYMVDEDDMYRIYLNQTGVSMKVSHSTDGGMTWLIDSYTMDQISGIGDVQLSFVNDKEAYLLYMSDTAAEHIVKRLYYMGASDSNIKEVRELTVTVENYPVDFDFYNKEIGCIITNYHSSTNFIYRTEDGGRNWNIINAPKIEAEYLYMEGYEIECISEKEMRLVVQIENSQRKYRKEFYTYDGGKTWGKEKHEYDSGFKGENE
ncbi:MAG: hypothetical protein J6B96_05585 [Agathobacter sp.]|nr:hypothetical protein [Agathobacter sp.]